MTGGGDYPMNPERYGRGVDRADFVAPKRQCCDSRLNELHESTCINVGLNAKWLDLGVIVDHGAAGHGVSVYDLSGEPMPVRLLAQGSGHPRSWGVRIPFEQATEAGEPPPLMAHPSVARSAEEVSRYRRPEDAIPGPTASLSVAEEESGGYRDFATVLKAEAPLIEDLAGRLVRELLDDYPDSDYIETYQRMAEFFVATILLHVERNEMAHDAWRRTGWAGNLMTLWGKAMRLMHNLWWHPNSEARTEKPLDHLADLATYAGFTAILFQAGDERGSER